MIRFLLAFFLCASALAVPVARLQVDGKTSSAVIFRDGNRTLALTSSEAVALSRAPSKHPHTLALGAERPTPAELKIADWGNGLALLEWTGRPPSPDWPTPTELTSATKAAGLLRLVSYGASADGAAVIARNSTRHTLATATPVLEVEGAIIDSSYVGGALVDKKGVLQGVISGEYLLLTPGYPTRPHHWFPGEKRSHVLVLGTPLVKAWLAGAVSGLRKYVEDQGAKDTERVVSDSRAYEAVCPAIGSSPTSGEFPVGGSNGLGSGGGIPGVHACRVRETANGVTRELPFVFRRDPDAGELDHDSFYSLGEMFPLRGRAGWKTATVLPPAAGEPKYRTLGRDAAQAASKQFGNLGIRDSKLSQAVRAAYLLARLADSEQAGELTRGDFDRLTDLQGPYGPAWVTLKQLYPLVTDYEVREKLLLVREALP